MTNKTILVTGGAGYIGSQTCKHVKQSGYVPVVFDNLETGSIDNVKWGEFYKGDLRNSDDINECIKKYNPIAVVHCAAYLNVFESVSKPGEYFYNNVVGTLNLLNAMKIHSVNYIVFSSTCAVYGNTNKLPIDETNAIAPITPYASSKYAAEQLIHSFDIAYGIKSVILRYFNVAGADEDCETGCNIEDASHLISVALKCAANIIDQIYVFGTDYPTRDGTCIRDYIHNKDLASAHLCAVEYLLNTHTSNIFNLGTGDGYSVKEIIQAVKEVTNTDFKVVMTDRREGDPSELFALPLKAHRVLNWNTRYSDLTNIIQTAYNWTLLFKK